MTVKELICEALHLVGRDDAAEAISGTAELSAEVSRIKNAFLTYLNSVIDELSRGYFPLSEREDVSFLNGKKALVMFSRRVVRIKKVFADNKEIEWHIYGNFLCADAEVGTVYYEYSPTPLVEEGVFVYPEYAVGEKLVEYGMAAEHFLVSGCAEESRMWEKKYHDEIEALIARCTVKPKIAPRRWI